MKKIFSLALLACLSYAINIDQKSIEVEFEGFKTDKFVPVKGKFDNIKYTLNKNNPSTLSEALKGAKAVIDPKSVKMELDVANANMINVFFPTFNNSKDIKVTFINVIQGDNQGVISAKITINKQSTIVPMHYIIQNDELVANGTMDIHAFKHGESALKALAKAAAGHKGISWNLVNLTFKAKIVK